MDPVVVCGGGIVGASVAYHLAELGVPVKLFERDTLGAGTSSDSIAVFTWYQEGVPHPVEHRLRERSWGTYGPLIEDGEIEFTRVGTLEVATGEAAADEYRDIADAHADCGVTAEWLGPDELAEFGLDPAAVEGGVHVPADGYLDPAGVIRYFVDEATERGATVETGVEVTDVRVEGGRVQGVETTDGSVDASAVVNAAGPWAPELDGMAGVSLPLRHTLGPILVLQREVPFSLPFVLFDDEVYFRGESTNQAFAGRFATGYGEAERLDPDAAHGIDESFYLDVEDAIAERIPRLEGARLTSEWVGVRTVTPDGRPYVGETSVAGFYAATGMSGLGITRAPAVGDLLARLIAGTDLDDRQAELPEYLAPARAR